ncbi:MAG TPA: 50S ribosomal protein L21 [bacterium]
MYAIVEMAGVQFKVSEAQKVLVPKLDEEPGKTVDFDKVLLVADKDNVQVGKPWIANAKVKAKVLSHGKGAKVLVYKKKSKKGYEKLRGHRQHYTEIQIEKITV